MAVQQSEPQSVEIDHVRKRFGNFEAVRDISLSVGAGEFVTFLGPSGCGKSTTLKILSGLLSQDSGEVRFGDRRIDLLPANKRNIGLVFQNYALFPHMTVAENIAFGLRMRGWSKADQAARVEELLELVRLEGLGDRKPDALSGGQQQRVAVARALAFRPDLVLLDEPLSNLDAKLREQVRLDLRDIQRQARQTTIFVTHDQVEALVMSDRIVLMNRGGVEQVGTPEDLYATPRTEFGARFVGANNLLEADLAHENGRSVAHLDGSGAVVPLDTVSPEAGIGSIWLCIRPEDIVPIQRNTRTEAGVTARVIDRVYQGTTMLLDLDIAGLGAMRAERPFSEVSSYKIGDVLEVAFGRRHAVPRVLD